MLIFCECSVALAASRGAKPKRLYSVALENLKVTIINQDQNKAEIDVN